MFKAGALFAGIGGFCVGFQHAGIKTVWASEIDPHAVESYSDMVDDPTATVSDVKQLKASSLEPVDVLHAGFPCQSFSQAGAKSGFDDERGRLFFEVTRIASEFGDERPKIIVLENSPFLRYGERGSWFLQVKAALQRAGYWFRDANASELDSFKLTTLPQQRTRLFMVALSTKHFRTGKFDFPSEIDTTPKNLADYVGFEDDVDDAYYLHDENRYASMIREHVDDDRAIYQLRKYFVRAKSPGVCPTLTANMGLGGHNVPFIVGRRGLRKLTEHECLKLQGFSAAKGFRESVPRWKRYHQVGNSVAVPVAQLLGQQVAKKLREGGY